jgi:hypothetical protein
MFYHGGISKEVIRQQYSILDLIIIALLIFAGIFFSFRIGFYMGARAVTQQHEQINAPLQVFPDDDKIKYIMIHKPCYLIFRWVENEK